MWCGVGKLGMGVSMCVWASGGRLKLVCLFLSGGGCFEWVWMFLFLEEDTVYSYLYCYYILYP